MDKREEEKNKSDLVNSPESSASISEVCMPQDIKSMSPEEVKAYLDDLFFSDLFREG